MTDIEMTENEVDARVYEVGYLLLPSIPEEQVSKHVSDIKKLIKDAGGSFISEEDPKLRHLTYEMTKQIGTRNERFRSAYFGWVKFDLPAQSAVSLKEKLDVVDGILRFILVKTVRENTYIPRAVVSEAGNEEVVTPVIEDGVVPIVVAPSVSEDLDKSIDALVAES